MDIRWELSSDAVGFYACDLSRELPDKVSSGSFVTLN